jgi:tungstate transport system ATP-binding protein
VKRDDLGLAPPATHQHIAAEPLISLAQASVHFGPVPALKNVHLQLNRGDRLALLGPNGSGKTTLLRLLHGLLPASAGERQLHPLAPEGRAPVGAMLFQHPFLLRLSVRRNVLLALWLRKVPKAQRAARCEQALQRVGLAALAGRPARDLSGGQQQRLALARAWAMQPDILFLDEPTASLDPTAKREVEALISDFAQDGVTVVMSTHNLGQAKRLCNRVAYLEAGRLVVVLPTDQFFNDELPTEATQFLKGELPWT